MKIQSDRHRTNRQFQVGEKVLLKLQPYVQQSVASRPYPKLAFKFFGPFEILEKIGIAAIPFGVARSQFDPSGILCIPT